MDEAKERCAACGRGSNEIPLLKLEYQGNTYWICPQDFPTLIHKPERLIGLLPGAEHLQGHNHDH